VIKLFYFKLIITQTWQYWKDRRIRQSEISFRPW